MDVHCSTCNEPWDVMHLREDEIFATDLTAKQAAAWQRLPPAQRLNERYRAKFRAQGWEFDNSVLNGIRCLSCPQDALANPETVARKAALEDLLRDDEDALAVTYEDHGL